MPPAESPSLDPANETRRVWPWVLALFVIAAGAATWYLVTRQDGGDAGETTAPLRFAEVVQTDLVEITTLEGTLGRSEDDPIRATAPGTITGAPEPGDIVSRGEVLYEIDRAPVILLYGDLPAYRNLAPSDKDFAVMNKANGTITWLPDAGTEIEQGSILYEVNGEPVIALYGEVPAYRSLSDVRGTNLTGDDILQLETALVELGFDPDGAVAVDGEYTGNTAAMVEDWEESIGATVNGTVALGDVVFIPGPTEVSNVVADVGNPAGSGVVLTLIGELPMSGDDVLQLEENLAALGYDADGSLAVDGVFDAATSSAVVAWQEDAGLETDGVVGTSEIVFRAGAVRVAAQTAAAGTQVGNGAAVLAVTSNEITVSGQIDAADQGLIAVGDPVTIELPDFTTTPGTVSEVATVALRTGQATVFPISIVLDDPAAAGSLDEAPVEIQIITDSVEDVMAVPVTALLALREGGYAVEVAAGDGTRLVAVEPGFFADGMVEVTSGGVAPGDRVVIP
jgi:peptidoglycan hydrolase-like protein with peptidoglycan-binding domain